MEAQLSRAHLQFSIHSAAPLGRLIPEHARVRQGQQQPARLQLPLPVAAHQLLHELQRKSTNQQQPRHLLIKLMICHDNLIKSCTFLPSALTFV